MSEMEPAPAPTKEELTEFAEIANQAIERYRGNVHELQGALGMLFVGRRLGWKALLLMHGRRTIRKYEAILAIDIQQQFPPVGDRAHKSAAYLAARKVTNFWKAVRGETKGVRSPELED